MTIWCTNKNKSACAVPGNQQIAVEMQVRSKKSCVPPAQVHGPSIQSYSRPVATQRGSHHQVFQGIADGSVPQPRRQGISRPLPNDDVEQSH